MRRLVCACVLLLLIASPAAAQLPAAGSVLPLWAGPVPLATGTGPEDTPALTVTLSCGVAAFPLHADQGEALINCADQALYAAKRQGRNRSQVCPPPAHAACG